ncbi:NAD(P)H-dependent oxidoreductase [Streptomyces durbertensis]|uniref:NAD(P)H-dependent oxidoreductase n=1 Tax=Streptomyces durbertensis TaxID=2448886 RepID=A0ABR6EGG6_9ACTN|nr:NADPH-dependent FMN reductase [Streptomyces durbertensis]MBB1244407.1 NAD(P)H-dependent oxidoreductase [Streptomyces durbertensis]
METLVITGSTATASTTARLAGAISRSFEQRAPGVSVTHLDRRLLRLPGLDADAYQHGELALSPDVRELGDRLAAARAVVLITPVQHGSYSGALKNLLDHAARSALRDRPVLLAATGGTLHLGASACDHLRAVARSLGGWTVPTQVIVERAELLTAPLPRLTARIDRAVDEVVLAARMLAPAAA